jgi:hypothetical protein
MRESVRHLIAKGEAGPHGLREFEGIELAWSAAFTAISDDGETADLDIAEILAESNAPGTSAVSPDFIGRPGCMTDAQIRDLRGWML